MVEQLFGSKTRVKLLQLFYSNPNRPFYVREITRRIDEQINSVRRELSNLLNIGIITSENTNNKLFYEVNQKFKYYEPLQQIFGEGAKKTVTKKKAAKGEEKATEVVEVIDDALKAVGQIDLVVYTGQFTRDDNAGVDVLIVGEVNENALQKYVADLEKQEKKSLRYAAMTLPDFMYRRQIRDRFITSIDGAKKQVIVDTNKLIEN